MPKFIPESVLCKTVVLSVGEYGAEKKSPFCKGLHHTSYTSFHTVRKPLSMTTIYCSDRNFPAAMYDSSFIKYIEISFSQQFFRTSLSVAGDFVLIELGHALE